MNIQNTIFIVNDISKSLEDIMASLPTHSSRVIRNIDIDKDEFQINEANLAIKEACIASSTTKYIILCGRIFRMEAQNALLKILEESPKNIVFLLLTESKTSILPTIFSRLYVRYLKKPTKKIELDLDIKNLDLKDVFAFLKTNQKVSKNEAKQIIEALLLKITLLKINLSRKELEFFTKSIRLLELNSKPINVLSTLLMTLVYSKNKK